MGTSRLYFRQDDPPGFQERGNGLVKRGRVPCLRHRPMWIWAKYNSPFANCQTGIFEMAFPKKYRIPECMMRSIADITWSHLSQVKVIHCDFGMEGRLGSPGNSGEVIVEYVPPVSQGEHSEMDRETGTVRQP